jgi:hypothetical protein
VSYSGTWRLDPAGTSRITDGAGLAGLIAAGAPPTLHMTHADNGTVVVESAVNEGQSRIYRTGGKTATPVAQGGVIAMTSRFGAAPGFPLIAEGTTTAANGATVKVRETYTISQDRKLLTIEVVVSSEGAPDRVSSLKYLPISDMGPCEKWSTPCKRVP